jgi:hypothetical protein
MDEAGKNLQVKKRSRATARMDSEEIPLSWEKREIDMDGIKRFFIRCVARAAVDELKRKGFDDERSA